MTRWSGHDARSIMAQGVSLGQGVNDGSVIVDILESVQMIPEFPGFGEMFKVVVMVEIMDSSIGRAMRKTTVCDLLYAGGLGAAPFLPVPVQMRT